MERYATLITAWQDADRQARFAELDLNQAYDRYFAQQGPAPTQEQREKVKRMREEANQRFRQATDYVNRTTHAGDAQPAANSGRESSSSASQSSTAPGRRAP